MSTPPLVLPADPGWIPSSLYRLTVSQYQALIESGALGERDRVHLINGFLVAKMVHNPPHATVCDASHAMLDAILPDGWYLRPDKPIDIPTVNMPELDLAVVRGHYQDYATRHPRPKDVALVVEVASSSLIDDLEMAAIYGRARIAVYGIIDLIGRKVEVYSQPGKNGYRSHKTFASGEHVPVTIGGRKLPPIAVDDLLPRKATEAKVRPKGNRG
jgi:Uma2 family endonuclease